MRVAQANAARRQTLLEENAAREPTFYVEVTHEELIDLSARYVPSRVVGMCRTLLDWEELPRRNALRPVKPAKTKKLSEAGERR